MKHTPEEVAKLLANRINQPHYIQAMIERCIAAAPAVQGEAVDELRFEYRHPKTGEAYTVSLSREEVAERMDQEIFEKLTACFCKCEPIGETNVVECRCDEYADEFDLIKAPQPAALPAPDACCPSCEGRGWDMDTLQELRPATCPDCAGSGKAEHSITVQESGRPAQSNTSDGIAHLQSCRVDGCERCEDLLEFYQLCESCSTWGHNDSGPCPCSKPSG